MYHKRRNGINEDGSVKPRLFQPRQGEVSTLVKDGCDFSAMSKMAFKLRPKRDRKDVVGFAVVRPSEAFSNSDLSELAFRVDYKPIARHGNIIGWDESGNVAYAKERNRHLAHKLATLATSWEANKQ